MIKDAILKAQRHLLEIQNPAGYWVGELIVDSTLCSDYLAFMHWTGSVDPDLEQKCVEHILARQLPDGGWNIYPEGPSEVNATVKAYFALKLAGFSPDLPLMAKARERAHALGGVEKTNTYARLYLALLGQVSWDAVPTIPVEFLLVPRSFPIHLHAVSSWTRAMVVPLAIINHFKPTRELPAELGIRELYVAPDAPLRLNASGTKKAFAREFFLQIDRILKRIEAAGLLPLRRLALRKAEHWILERIGDGCSGLAAIFPAMLNCLIALRSLGYGDEHPTYAKAVDDFRELFVDDEEGFRIQPCLSPVWDTAISLVSLLRSGISGDHPQVRRAATWLADREVRMAGDWAVNNPAPEPSGWCFEFNNPFFPDVDDTAMVLLALGSARYQDDPSLFDRAIRWLLSFQCKDGGWAAFDKDVINPLLEHVPFADHNAILDPSCCDVTARVLEALAQFGFTKNHPAVKKALHFLRERQEPSGAWYGRWGVNYIYGTSQVLRGLSAVGVDMTEPWVQHGRSWLETHQRPDGGWGEACDSYVDPARAGQGRSTASQTAWALLGLCAFHDVRRDSVFAGLDYLIRNQNPDGSWDEDLITGTGFPRVFYLKYDLYRNNWPLMAMAKFVNRTSQVTPQSELSPLAIDRQPGPVSLEQEPALAFSLPGIAALPIFHLVRQLLGKLFNG